MIEILIVTMQCSVVRPELTAAVHTNGKLSFMHSSWSMQQAVFSLSEQ